MKVDPLMQEWCQDPQRGLHPQLKGKDQALFHRDLYQDQRHHQHQHQDRSLIGLLPLKKLNQMGQ